MSNELIALRNVYESARKLFRYNGIDKAKVDEAFDQLGDDIEVVKMIDSGLADEPIQQPLSVLR